MYEYTYTCKLQTIAVHLKTISFVGQNYFNLYGAFLIKSNDVTVISIALWSGSKKLIKVVLTQERILVLGFI